MKSVRLLNLLKHTSTKRILVQPIAQTNFQRYYGAAAGLTKPVIQERIMELLNDFDKVEHKALAPEAHFTKDLKLDSLDTVEVIMALEEEFSIEIPDFDSDEIKTVKDAVDYIALRNDAV